MSRVASAQWRISANFLPILAIFLVTGLGLFMGWLYAPVAVFAFVAAGWIVSLCLHEASHALVAYWGGDRSVAEKGYLSLDPLAYAHPLLSFGLPMLFLLLGGIGLPGGGVYINRVVLRTRHWDALVSAAGPAANAVILLVLSIPFLLELPLVTGTPVFWAALGFLAALQAMGALLNLIPFPGLDGFGIIRPYLPYSVQAQANRIGSLLGFVLLFLFMSPQVGGAIWRTIFQILMALNIDPRYAVWGEQLFRFWS